MASVHNLIVKRGEAEILKNFSAEFPEPPSHRWFPGAPAAAKPRYSPSY